jgi:hypothetical protein
LCSLKRASFGLPQPFLNPVLVSSLSFLFQAFEELERLLGLQNICVAVKEKLTKDSGVAGAGAYDHIVDKLQAKPKARGE